MAIKTIIELQAQTGQRDELVWVMNEVITTMKPEAALNASGSNRQDYTNPEEV